MNAEQLKNDEVKAAEKSKYGSYVTARQMAFKPHSLSERAMAATTADGAVWRWSNHFNVWVCTECK